MPWMVEGEGAGSEVCVVETVPLGKWSELSWRYFPLAGDLVGGQAGLPRFVVSDVKLPLRRHRDRCHVAQCVACVSVAVV